MLAFFAKYLPFINFCSSSFVSQLEALITNHLCNFIAQILTLYSKHRPYSNGYKDKVTRKYSEDKGDTAPVMILSQFSYPPPFYTSTKQKLITFREFVDLKFNFAW